MRTAIARRRTMAHGLSGSSLDKAKSEELCSICHRPDETKRGRLTSGTCTACYSWWRNTSLKTPKELTSYLGGLTIRVERFSIRASLLSNRSPLLPTIHHKPQEKL